MSHSKPQTPVWRPPPRNYPLTLTANPVVSFHLRAVNRMGLCMISLCVRFSTQKELCTPYSCSNCFFFSSSTHTSYIRRGHSNVAEQNATSMAEIECPLQLTPYPPRSYVQVHRLRASPPWLPLSTYVHFCFGRRTHVTTNPIINCEHVRHGFFLCPPTDEIVDLFISR